MRPIEYRTTIIPHKKVRNATPYYLTQQQRHTLIRNLGDVCYIVFSYYIEKAGIKDYDYSDSRVAKALGYDVQKVQRARLKLIKQGWFLQSTYTNKEGRKVIMTYLGQEAVHDYKKNGHVIRITQVNLEAEPTITEH